MVIGISGKKATGKDLLGKFLIEKHGFRKESFAAYLKQRVKDDFGLTEEQVNGAGKEGPTQYGIWTPRTILQAYGSFFRTIDIDFWVRKTLERLKQSEGGRFVITDVRYPNEADAIKAAGGVVVRLERSLAAREQVYPGCGADIHESETGLDSYKKWDLIVYEEENKTPADLEEFADNDLAVLWEKIGC